ncbi:AAR2 protein [Sarocladium implicatum]|nr:AAR2 protein [Sarocladium implicatum]
MASRESSVSHASVPATGTHPVGTLHVHDEDQSPPPLENARNVSAGDVSLTDPSILSATGNPDEPGDVLVALDMPADYIIGYDAVSFTAKNFTGVSAIPPGPHFLWWTSPNGVGTRSGLWVVSSSERKRVHVLQWSSYEETLVETSRAEARIQAQGIPGSSATLLDSLTLVRNNDKIWSQLCGYITPEVLSRVTGHQGDKWHIDTVDRVKGEGVIAAEVELDRRVSHSLSQFRELEFIFSQHAKTYTTSNNGRDRTLEATDATPYVNALVNGDISTASEGQLVGELQLAFIVGVNLGNDACVQQWWHMVLNIILKAYLLPSLRPVLVAGLLKSLAAQLTYSSSWVESSPLNDDSGRARDLRLSLTIYKRRLDELLASLGSQATPAQELVQAAFASVEEAASSSLDWDISGDYLRKGRVALEDGEEVELEMDDLEAEDERGEFAPEVVELDEKGKQRDLVSWTD